jgi:NAD(P)H-dependent FMN reductase
MTKSKILVIVGTTRNGRKGRLVADWYLREARKLNLSVDLELLDIADEKLELFNEPVSPMTHQYSPVQEHLAGKIGDADGFVFVTGEYNHSVPASLKNFIDYLHAEWAYKPVAYVGYGSNGGVRSIEHLIQIMTELKGVSVATGGTNVTINAIWEALDDDGYPKPGYQFGSIETQLTELLKYAETLKPLRSM